MTIKVLGRKRGLVTIRIQNNGKTAIKRLGANDLLKRYGGVIWTGAISDVGALCGNIK